MTKRELAFYVAQMGIMYAFAVLANVLHSTLPIVIWMASALALGIFWERISSERTAEKQESNEIQTAPLVRAFAVACGIAGAAVIAATDIGLWRRQGILFSLIGVQFCIPFGAFVLGAIVSTIYLWTRGIVKMHLRTSDLYVVISLAALSMALSYFMFFQNQRSVISGSSGDVLKALTRENLLGGKDQLFGIAPVQCLTPFIQFVGYAVGGWVAYWRENRHERN